jgi:hypothetical protein
MLSALIRKYKHKKGLMIRFEGELLKAAQHIEAVTTRPSPLSGVRAFLQPQSFTSPLIPISYQYIPYNKKVVISLLFWY